MHLDEKKTHECFKKVKYIKEHAQIYCLSPDRVPVSVEDLFRVVSDMYDMKISKQDVVYEGEWVNSLVERYNNQHAIVYVKHNLEDHYKRFCATKELMHLAIDEPEDWSVDGTETLAALFVEMSFDNGNVAENVAQSEVFAEIAAIEILYPYEFRALDRKSLADQTTSLIKLSLEYEIPTFIVARALSEWYDKIATSVWGHLNSQDLK